MNLIVKMIVFYLLVFVLVFGIGGYVIYYVVEMEVIKEMDYVFYDEVQDMASDIWDGIFLEILCCCKVEIEYLGDYLQVDIFYWFLDIIVLYFYCEGEIEFYWKLEVVKEVDGSFFYIIIIDVFIEFDDIYDVVVEIIWWFFFIFGVGMLIVSFLVI